MFDGQFEVFGKSDAGKKTEFCLCKHCSLEENTSVLWQPIPMFWDFCVIFMMFDSGRPIFGIFMGLLWCSILVGPFLGFLWDLCGIFMELLWDFVGLLCFWLAQNYRTNSGIAMASKQIVFFHSF